MMTRPLKWYGGKGRITPWLRSLMPPVETYTQYVEPYAGGLALLLALTDRHLSSPVAELVNDRNRELTNFWRVLQSPKLFTRMRRRLEATPPSEVEFNLSLLLAGAVVDPVDDACRFLVRFRMSRSADGRTFAPVTRNRTRRGMNAEAAAWLGVIDGLTECHERMRRVFIFNSRDAVDLIQDLNTTRTFFYLDPPYLGVRDHYDKAEGHSEAHHARLLFRLERICGRFMLSGYDSEMYDEWSRRNGFMRYSKDVQFEGGPRTERVWLNYDPAYGARLR